MSRRRIRERVSPLRGLSCTSIHVDEVVPPRKLDCRECTTAFALVDVNSGAAVTFCRCRSCPNREQMEALLAEWHRSNPVPEG